MAAPASSTRRLTLSDATMIVIGSMIGSGIFIVSIDVARNLGAPGWVLGCWIITGIVTVIAALSYAELASMMPQAGGQYVYLREAYNPMVGFLYGWTSFLVIETGTIAAVATAFARYTGVLFPQFIDEEPLLTLLGLPITSIKLLAVGVSALLTAINLRGIQEARFVQTLFTITKTTALLGLIVLGIAVGLQKDIWSLNAANFWDTYRTQLVDGKVSVTPLSGSSLLTALGLAMVGPLFSSSAWNNVTFIAGEVKNPRRDIPWSLLIGTLVVSFLYVSANVAYLLLLPVQGSPDAADAVSRGIMFASNGRLGTAAAEQLFGSAAAVIMAVFIMVSTFGCNNGIILAGGRLVYAMAREGLFFKSAGLLNRRGVPAKAILIQSIWASLLALSGTYSQLLDYTVFVILLFYILTIAGVFILRRKQPDTPRPYRVWAYPVLPAIYVIFATFLCVNLLIFKAFTSGVGLLIVALGIPVYAVWRKNFVAQEESVPVQDMV